ncbi:hypothetical protein [Tropicimonas sediminicola]|uniref:Uncharacterized protein n=1 Tax=Tropicimonas sediminicola TaxID=1031541 RepID=A0A239FIF8_9RHOB|nr:hypothetical protein [Tropicimonas sediminicola]SNS56746.1 hypothetical protein SAMN05421757_102691 [Tropicimonas sediminicola]
MSLPDYKTEHWTMWFMTGCHIDGLVPPNVVAVPTVYLDVRSKFRASERTLACITAQRLKLDPIFTEALIRVLKGAADGLLSEARA